MPKISMGEVKGVLALKEGKERKCVVIFLLRVTLLEIALILPVGNVEKKDMKKSHDVLSNFLEFALWNKRMNQWSMIWMNNWQNVLNKRKIENESKKSK